MNPYATFVGKRDPLPIIRDTPHKLTEVLNALGPTNVEWHPLPGKWNAREILCHLADSEIVFAFRLRQALAEDHHVIQPFDQDKWAAVYGNCDAKLAVELFYRVRAWNVALIESVPAAAMAKRVTHPERGEMTFRTIIETMAGHDLNHIPQLEAIVSSFAGS